MIALTARDDRSVFFEYERIQAEFLSSREGHQGVFWQPLTKPVVHKSQWNPCRSRGASCLKVWIRMLWLRRLSGTPAEAGVRGGDKPSRPPPGDESQWNPCRSRGARSQGSDYVNCWFRVSVEPLPKQGCENPWLNTMQSWVMSQWNPCRSRGARRDREYVNSLLGDVSVEPLPKQGCEQETVMHRLNALHVSVEPLPKQGCEPSSRMP